MPYNTTNALPDAVQELPEVKQRQWLHVFNAVYKETRSEARAFKAAWSKTRAKVAGGTPKSPVRGFTADVQPWEAGKNEWEAQIGGPGVIYKHPEFGKLRICPDLWVKLAIEMQGKPTTLNHSDTENGIITKAWVNDDGDPWARWIVNEDTYAMMTAEDWAGGVSPSIVPLKIIKDPTAVADGIVVDGTFDSLGIGDGSMDPACALGVCAPKKVEGMTDNENTDEDKDKDDAAKKLEEEKAAFEKNIADIKASTTEEGFKSIETLLKGQQEKHDAEMKALNEKFDTVTKSDDSLKKWKEEREAADLKAAQDKLAAQIEALPDETKEALNINVEDKSLDELTELAGIINAVAPKKPGQTGGGGRTDAPEPKSPDAEADEIKRIREINKAAKAKRQKSALLEK